MPGTDRKRAVPQLVAAGAVALGLAGAAALVAINADTLVRHAARAGLHRELGAQASLWSVGAWRWDGAGRDVVLDDVVIAEAPGAGPLARLGRVRLRFDLPRFLLTWGREARVALLQLDAPELRLRRAPDGTWNAAPLLASIEAMLSRPEPAYRRPAIDNIVVNHGRLVVRDDATRRDHVLEGVHLQARNFAPGRDLEVSLEMGLDQPGAAAPLKLEARVKGLPARWDPGNVPDTWVKVAAGKVELAPWSFLLPPEAPRVEQGALDADLEAWFQPGRAEAQVRGPLRVLGLVLASDAGSGAATDLSLEVDAAVTGPGHALAIRKLDVAAPALALRTRLELDGPALAKIRGADIALHVEDMARALAALPPGTAALPDELVLQGPVDLRVEGDAGEGVVQVDLDRARVAFGRWLDKPAGRPMHAGMTLVRVADRIRVRSLAGALDRLGFHGSAELPVDPAAAVDVDVDTGAVSVMELQRVVPLVADAVRAHGRVGGQVRMRVRADVVDGEQQLHAQALLTGLEVRAPWASVAGNAVVSASVLPGQPRSTAALSALLDDLEVRVLGDGGEVLLDKPRRYPASAEVHLVYGNSRVAFEDARVSVGGSRVRLRGGVDVPERGAATLDLVADPLELSFDDLRQLSPGATALPPGGRVSARVRLTGNPRRPASLRAVATGVDLRAGASSAAGTLEVASFDDPVVQAAVQQSTLRVQDVRQWAASAGGPGLLRDVLRALPRGLQVRARAAVALRPSQPGSLLFTAEDMRWTAGRSEARGTLTLDGGPGGQVDCRLDGLEADLGELRTLGGPQWLPPQGRLDGRLRVRARPGHPEELEVALDGLHAQLLGSDVAAWGTWRGVASPAVDLVLRGKRVDADTLAAGLPRDASPPGQLRRRVAALAGRLRVVLERARAGGVELDNLVADLRLGRGDVVAEHLSLGALGGLVNADGARLELGSPRPRVRVDFSAHGLDLARLSRSVLDDPGALGGSVDVTANLTASGATARELRASLDGPFTVESREVRARDVALYPRTPLRDGDVRPIDPGADADMVQDGRPYFRNLTVSGRLEGQRITLTQPLLATTPFGDIALLGVVEPPQRVALAGTTTMSPDAVARMTLGAYRPESRTVAPLRIGGTPGRMVLERLDVTGFVDGAAPSRVLEGAHSIARGQAAQLRKRLAEARAGAERIRAEAGAQAADEAQRVRARLDAERDVALREYGPAWERRQAAAWRAARDELRRLVASPAPEGRDGGPAASGP